jgi:signal transduction histidine kinase
VPGKHPIAFRGLFLIGFGAMTMGLLLLAAIMLWLQNTNEALAARSDMARRQALLVTRLEADTAYAARGPSANDMRKQDDIKRTALAYLASIEEERALIGDDAQAQNDQRLELREAQRLLMLTQSGTTAGHVEGARALSHAIAARENAEAEQAEGQALAVRQQSWRLICITIFALTALLAAIGVFLWRGLVAPLDRLVRATCDVADELAPTRVEATGLKEMRRLIHHFNGMVRSIEERIARRTTELEEANHLLAATDERRRLFLSKVSHELRTPVTVMRGEAEIALRLDGGEAALRDSLQHILDSNIFLHRRLDDLMALARADNGALSLRSEPVDLAQLARRAARTAASFASNSGVRLEAVGLGRAIPFRGDPDRLQQALVAIIDNGVKFSPPGATIRISAERRKGHHAIVIADNGPGVAPDDLDRIFDPYVQTASGRSLGGTGLGLSLARWITEAHRGVISARNRPAGECGEGEGLCVSLTFPTAA